MDAYTQWTNEKDNIKGLGKTPNLDNFCDFYEKLVLRQSDAQYVRNTMDSLNNNKKDENNEPRKDTRKSHSATLLQSSLKKIKNEKTRKIRANTDLRKIREAISMQYLSKEGSKIHIVYFVNAKVTQHIIVKAGNLHLIKRRKWPASTMLALYV